MTDFPQNQDGTSPQAPPDAGAPSNQPSAPPAAPSTGGGRPSSGGDDFQGMSREEVIGRYREIARQREEAQGYLDTLSNVFRQYSFLFDVSNDGVKLNDENIARYAQTQGLAGQKGASGSRMNSQGGAQGRSSPGQMAGGNGDLGGQGGPSENGQSLLEQLETGGEGFLMDKVRQAVKEAIQGEVTPHLTEFWRDRGERWVDMLKSKYPDFEKYRGKAFDFAQATNFQIRTPQDLEKAYKAAKAFEGGYVDRAEHEALQGLLNEARQVINPNAAEPDMVKRALDPNGDVEDLLGLNMQPTGAQAEVNQLLFGKRNLRP